jgi:hypothetical protein
MQVMKLKRYASVVVATLALFGLIGWSVYAQKKGPERIAWEYREAISLSEQQANALGAEGWEMVGFSVDSNGNKFMFFKRPK